MRQELINHQEVDEHLTAEERQDKKLKELQEQLEELRIDLAKKADNVPLRTIIKNKIVRTTLAILALITLGDVAAEAYHVTPRVSPYGENGPVVDLLDKEVVQILATAEWYTEHGDPIKAAEKYQEAAQADPNNHYLWAMLGEFVISQKNLLPREEGGELDAEEVIYFSKYDTKGIWKVAYELEPDNAEYVANWAYYGNLIFNSSLDENPEFYRTPLETIALAHRAIELGDESGKADSALGMAYASLEQWDNAIFYLRSSLNRGFIDRGFVYMRLLRASKNAGYEVPYDIVERALADPGVVQRVKISVGELLEEWND